MKCEKCGKEIDSVLIDRFNYDGSDSYEKTCVEEAEENAIIMETDSNWTGYELTEEEQCETIKCPHCNQFPFVKCEVQIYKVIRLVCFKTGSAALAKEGEK